MFIVILLKLYFSQLIDYILDFFKNFFGCPFLITSKYSVGFSRVNIISMIIIIMVIIPANPITISMMLMFQREETVFT